MDLDEFNMMAEELENSKGRRLLVLEAPRLRQTITQWDCLLPILSEELFHINSIYLKRSQIFQMDVV